MGFLSIENSVFAPFAVYNPFGIGRGPWGCIWEAPDSWALPDAVWGALVVSIDSRLRVWMGLRHYRIHFCCSASMACAVWPLTYVLLFACLSRVCHWGDRLGKNYYKVGRVGSLILPAASANTETRWAIGKSVQITVRFRDCCCVAVLAFESSPESSASLRRRLVLSVPENRSATNLAPS